MPESKFLVVKLTICKIVGWICVLLFLFCALMSWRAGETGVSVLFLFFVALGLFLIISFGSNSLQVNSETIVYKTPFSCYQILWEEVENIKFDRQDNTLVFIGKNKQLPIAGWQYWSGKDKSSISELLSEQCVNRSIDVIESRKAMFMLSKNTKIH